LDYAAFYYVYYNFMIGPTISELVELGF